MDTDSIAARPPRIFRGWLVVAGAFAVTFVGFGSAYTFSAFVGPLQNEFAASRGSISLVFSLAAFLYFSLGVVTGPLADRGSSRRLALIGMLSTGAGLAIAAAAQSLTEVYVAYGLGVGIGIGCSFVPALGAVQRWFTLRRGLATGMAVSGIGVGTFVMPLVASRLIATFGWRKADLVLGCLVGVVGIATSWMIENDPRDRGLAPDGGPAVPGASTVQAAGDSVRGAITSRTFAALYAACLICALGLFVPFIHLVPYARTHGLTNSSAILLLGVIGVASIAGRCVVGAVADRLGRRPALATVLLGMGAAFAVWLCSTTLWPLVAFALVYGVFYGGFVALLPTVVMDDFGGRNVSGIMGILYTSVAFGTLIGPTAAGFVFDRTHSYTLPILGGVFANIIAAGITMTTARAPQARPGAGEQLRRARCRARSTHHADAEVVAAGEAGNDARPRVFGGAHGEVARSGDVVDA